MIQRILRLIPACLCESISRGVCHFVAHRHIDKLALSVNSKVILDTLKAT